MIPKIIYQTWKTQNLPPQVKKIQNKMLKINPDERIQWDELFKINLKAFKKPKIIFNPPP